MNKDKKKKQILIIGGGRRGLATIEVLNEDEEIDIMAVVDLNLQASGIKLAQRLGLKTDSDWEKYIDTDPLPDAILNLTGNTDIQKLLLEKTRNKDIEILGDVTLRILGNLLMERQVQTELHRVSQRITSNIGLDELMVLILSSCVKGTKADGGIIVLHNADIGQWEVKSNWGVPEETEQILLERASHRLSVWPEKDEAVPLLERINKNKEDVSPDINNNLCSPLRFRGMVNGAIIIINKNSSRQFSNSSKRLLSTFANQSSVAIENILLYKQSKHLSITDGLTGVYNHRFFQEQLETELSRAQRYDLNFSLIMVDLDNFKEINDTHGHLQGDKILKKVSVHIEKALRGTDIVARYGGDEFSILLPETEKKDAVMVAERIRKGLIEKKIGEGIPIHVSVGIAAYPDDGVYGDDLINKADSALYKAKENGRNKTCVA